MVSSSSTASSKMSLFVLVVSSGLDSFALGRDEEEEVVEEGFVVVVPFVMVVEEEEEEDELEPPSAFPPNLVKKAEII